MANNEIRFGQKFGHSDVFPGDGQTLSSMDQETRVEAMAWFHACPVRREVVNEFGSKWTLKRYTECNWVQKYEINSRAEKTNPSLYKQLTTPVSRLPGELPDPKIDRTQVPPSFETEMSPASTPEGYSLSRMILVGARDEKGKWVKEKGFKIKAILDQEIPIAKDTIGLTVSIGEKLIEMGADEEKILGHLMSAGILKEEGCKTRYKQILERMEKEAPKMHEAYVNMCRDMEKIAAEQMITPDQLK